MDCGVEIFEANGLINGRPGSVGWFDWRAMAGQWKFVNGGTVDGSVCTGGADGTCPSGV